MKLSKSIEKKIAFLLSRFGNVLPDPVNSNAIFISGFGRSGTTLLVSILEYHSGVAIFPGEANELWHPYSYPWYRHYRRLEIEPYWSDPIRFSDYTLSRLKEKDIERIIKNFLFIHRWKGRDKAFLNKSAMITFLIPFIAETFPGAKFVILIRDGRAAAYSYAIKQINKIEKYQDRYGGSKGITFGELCMKLAYCWQAHIDYLDILTEKMKDSLNLIYLKYEDLSEQPEKTLSKFFKFTEIGERQLDYDDFNKIKSRNYKVSDQLDPYLFDEMTTIMRSGLVKFGYL